MKIVYLFTSPSPKGSSVQTKVLNQIKYLNLAGAECRGAFFSTEVQQITPLNEQVDLIPVKKCDWKYFRLIGQRRLLDKTMFDFIKSKQSQTDIFYLRYPGASIGLFKIAKYFGGKIISEHQSKEIEEIKSFNQQYPLGLRPSKFISWYLYYYLPIYNENKWGKLFVRKIKATVSVTNEIANYQFKKGSKNALVNENGIEVDQFKIRSFPEVKKNKIIILFLKGSSSDIAWSGIDRLIDGINEFNKVKTNCCELILAGMKESKYENISFIKQIGYVKESELDELFSSVHIGSNHLAMHRINLKESSNLKIREYYSRGLPFIYASYEKDIESNSFSLQFRNDDSPIDIQKVIDFTQKVLSDAEHPLKMRKYAEEHLDYSVKMKRLLEKISI
jgi:hypothetical protein